MSDDYPPALDPAEVGEYPAVVQSGGGYVWDAVLEYRVWCHPHEGADDPDDDGSDYYAFATYAEALAFSEATKGAEKPLALVLQKEFIEEPEPGQSSGNPPRPGQGTEMTSRQSYRAGRLET
jgi:hypothetical protein